MNPLDHNGAISAFLKLAKYDELHGVHAHLVGALEALGLRTCLHRKLRDDLIEAWRARYQDRPEEFIVMAATLIQNHNCEELRKSHLN